MEELTGELAPFPLAKFLEFLRYLKIQSKDYGLVPFKLLGSQQYILNEMAAAYAEGVSDFKILKARQLGSTSLLIALGMFWAFEHRGLLGAFVLHKEEARDDWRAAIEVFYQEIPRKVTTAEGRVANFKPAMTAHNRNLLAFKNNSRFRYLIAGTAENRKGGLGRSGASNYTHMTEAAFYGSPEDVAAYMSSTSSLYPHRLTVMETTANGFNWFADDWEDALKSKATRCIFVPWWRDERNQFGTRSAMYQTFMPDRSLTVLERQRVREVRDNWGFQITLQQLAWYRWHMSEKKFNDQSLMDQENPWTADHAFQATGAKYFTTASLTHAVKQARHYGYIGYRYRMSGRWEETEVQQFKDPRAELRVWEQSSRFGYYAIGCDPAYGSSDEANRNVISVWRCFADGIDQVAEYCTSSHSMYQTAWALAHLAGFYGQLEVQVIVELNGPGKAVFDELKTIQGDLRRLKPATDNYELRNCLNRMRDYFFRRIDNPGATEMPFHIVMTEDLKRMIMTSFKDAFELDRLRVRSVPLIEEMRRMINDEGHISAEGAGNDDRVIGAALAWEVYKRYLRQKLLNMGMTRAKAASIEANGGESNVNKVITNYLRRSKISVSGAA